GKKTCRDTCDALLSRWFNLPGLIRPHSSVVCGRPTSGDGPCLQVATGGTLGVLAGRGQLAGADEESSKLARCTASTGRRGQCATPGEYAERATQKRHAASPPPPNAFSVPTTVLGSFPGCAR